MKRPIVLIDGVVFETGSQRGIWRVFFEVMSRTHAQIDYRLLLTGPPKLPVPENVEIISRGPRCHPFAKRDMLCRWLAKPANLRLAKQHPGAIWHSTFYGKDPRNFGKKVVTVYDMIPEMCYSIGDYVAQRELRQTAIPEADLVICISKTTYDDFCRFYPQMASRTRVVPLGGDHLLGELHPPLGDLQGNSETLGISGAYALFLGGRYGYKNFVSLLQSLADPNWPPDVPLCVVGAPFDSAEEEYIRALGVSARIKHLGQANDDRLMGIYRNAICFVFPSTQEGFGIPVVESQSLGVVPALSDTRIFREIAGNGAIFFDPYNPSHIARSVASCMDPATRTSLRESMRVNAERYTWDQTAKQMVECYNELGCG